MLNELILFRLHIRKVKRCLLRMRVCVCIRRKFPNSHFEKNRFKICLVTWIFISIGLAWWWCQKLSNSFQILSIHVFTQCVIHICLDFVSHKHIYIHTIEWSDEFNDRKLFHFLYLFLPFFRCFNFSDSIYSYGFDIVYDAWRWWWYHG